MTKKVIFGLGNPGEKYSLNRHNAGALFINFLSEKLGANLKELKRLTCRSGKAKLFGKELILVQPLTFMNLSGQVVLKFTQYFKIKPEQIIVAHDDLDIPLGKFRIDFARGPRLHKGIISIEQALRTKDFLRIRIGIDNRKETGKIKGDIYVLQNFSEEELKKLKLSFLDIFQKLLKSLKNEF